MATRAITTNQPEVSCDVCGRRLLRGERPDVFLASGSRRVVCELCIPRATDEGWMRESDALMVAGARGSRTRRGRSLLDRLRQRDRLPQRGGWAPEEAYWQGGQADEPPVEEGDASSRAADALGEQATHEWAAHEQVSPEAAPRGQVSHDVAPHEPVSHDAAEAIEVFNASPCSTRVAGIARALGEPSVTVSLDSERDRVPIVVAWELCWYRYEVDLSQAPATIGLVGEGTELEELPSEDRLSNAVANERGELSLLR